jgi:hypothetical protein
VLNETIAGAIPGYFFTCSGSLRLIR